MKSNKELDSFIIGIGRLFNMIGQIIFFLGLFYWFVDPGFGIYLMLAGTGLVFMIRQMIRQKVKNIYLIEILRRINIMMRKRSRNKKNLPKKE